MSTIKPSVGVVTPFVIGLFPRLKRIVLDNEFSGETFSPGVGFQMDLDETFVFMSCLWTRW